jgi:hypothetical protein
MMGTLRFAHPYILTHAPRIGMNFPPAPQSIQGQGDGGSSRPRDAWVLRRTGAATYPEFVKTLLAGGRMVLEIYIWSWIHLHPGHLLRKTAKYLGLAALVLIPLFYSNIYLIRQGFKPTPPSLHMQASSEQFPR